MIANRFGFIPTNKEDMPLDWNDTIYDGEYRKPAPKSILNVTAEEELIRYLELLFKNDEHIYYVTSSRFENGKHHPCGGDYSRTAGEIIDALKNGASINDVLGEINPKRNIYLEQKNGFLSLKKKLPMVKTLNHFCSKMLMFKNLWIHIQEKIILSIAKNLYILLNMLHVTI